MNYYVMQQDSKSQEAPRVVNWFQKIDVEAMEPGSYYKLPQVTVLEATTAPNTHYKELVLKPFLLLPKEAGNLLKSFEPWMEFRDVVLWDKTKRKNHRYVFPLLQRYDCLSEESVLNLDKTILQKGVLKEKAIPDQVLFMPEKVNSRVIIAREDFVEALLQNGFFGYTLTKLEVRKEHNGR